MAYAHLVIAIVLEGRDTSKTWDGRRGRFPATNIIAGRGSLRLDIRLTLNEAFYGVRVFVREIVIGA